MRVVRSVKRASRNPNFWPVVQMVLTLLTVALMGYVVWLAATEHSARAASETASKKDQVTQCFQKNEQGPAAIRFFSSLNTILRNQIAAAAIVVVAGGPTAPTYKRIGARARESLADIRAVEALTRATTPTREECIDLAERLGVRTSTNS